MVKILQVKIYDKAQLDFLETQGNQSDFIRDLIDDYRKGNLVKKNFESEDGKYKQLRNQHLEIKIKIDTKKLFFMNNFNHEPSSEAEAAIKEGVNRELTESEFENVNKYITLRRDSMNPSLWIGKCDLCKEGENYNSIKEAKEDLARHLTADHSKKIMEIEN